MRIVKRKQKRRADVEAVGAFVRQQGADAELQVIYAHNFELEQISGRACLEETGTIQVNGTATGHSGTSQVAQVTANFASVALAQPQTTFSLTQLPSRPVDLIASRVNLPGLTGAEAGIAGGSAVVGQKLLEAVFGDQAVRRLATNARKDLNRRVIELLDTERRRYLDVLDDLDVDPEGAENIRGVARRIDDLRFAAQIAPTPAEESSLQKIAPDDVHGERA